MGSGYSVRLSPEACRRVEEIRDYLEETLDRPFSLDKVVSTIICQVELRGIECETTT